MSDALLGVVAALPMLVDAAAAQAPAPATPHAAAAPGERLPFLVGEQLTHRVHSRPFGAVGRLTMVVDTAETVRGTAAWVLRFDFRAGVGPIGAVDRTASWLDPVRLTALRFHKHERHPLPKHDAGGLSRRSWLAARHASWSPAQRAGLEPQDRMRTHTSHALATPLCLAPAAGARTASPARERISNFP